ncbi:MAG: biotin/lipoyl-binding protein [Oscillospiraceae bacterium]|jgi:biotin carboxyl carrier protein|nr:biotin/lipoyl-binding protein [Oscillospiraceae bacterium]
MKYKITLNQKVYEVEVEQGEAILVSVADAPVAAAPVAAPVPAAPVAAPVAAAPAAPAAAAPAAGEEVIASPLPGNILAVKVAAGDTVTKGQVLLIIEAMKMENEVLAPRDGVVAQVVTSKGSVVETGAPLLTLK